MSSSPASSSLEARPTVRGLFHAGIQRREDRRHHPSHRSRAVRKHNARIWLINTGWSGGPYGVGKRMKLSYTRKMVDAIHNGELAGMPTERDAIFGFDVPTQCPGVPSELLQPRATWADPQAYDETAKKLAGLFIENFKAYESGASEAIRSAAPVTE